MGAALEVYLGQVAAVRVDRDRPFPADAAAGHERAAFADRAETPVLQAHEHRGGERVVEERDVDVARAEAGPGVQVPGGAPVPGAGVNLAVGVERGAGPLVFAGHGDGPDAHRRLAQIPGPLWRRHDHGGRAVGFHAAVIEPERVGDQPGRVVFRDRDLGAEPRVGIADGVAPRVDRHFGEVLGGRAVQAHVPPGLHRVYRGRQCHAERSRVRSRQRDGAARPDAGGHGLA
jgi:hypothetical protein